MGAGHRQAALGGHDADAGAPPQKRGRGPVFGAFCRPGPAPARAGADAARRAQIIFCVTIQNKQLEFGEGVPAPLAALGSACLAKDPAGRPTFPEVLKALDALPADALRASPHA